MNKESGQLDIRKVPVAVVVGDFQNGKSTLVNCLLDDKYARMGKGCRTTACCTRFVYGESEEARLFHGLENPEEKLLDRREDIFAPSFSVSGKDCIEITCWKPMLRTVSLIDTPGFDASTEDDETAKRAISQSDIVIIVHKAAQLDENTLLLAKNVYQCRKKVLFLYNCTNDENWAPSDSANEPICATIEAQLESGGLSSMLIPINGRRIWPCNPLLAWYAQGHLQRDLESPSDDERKDAEKAICKIKNYCSDELKKTEKRSILEASGILPVRRALENVAASLLEAFKNNPKDEVKLLTNAWMKRISGLVGGEHSDRTMSRL